VNRLAHLAVYDAVVMLQWAALPPEPDRQHATVAALTSGRMRLAMSQPLLDEIRSVFFRPEIQDRFPSLTAPHAAAILKKAMEFADVFVNVPRRFTLPRHPKDDHLFDLAIESKASYLITWENRILRLDKGASNESKKLHELAPDLRIMSPATLAKELRADSQK
jgi:putative PIN family toxin of toxin-antitoxin system